MGLQDRIFTLAKRMRKECKTVTTKMLNGYKVQWADMEYEDLLYDADGGVLDDSTAALGWETVRYSSGFISYSNRSQEITRF